MAFINGHHGVYTPGSGLDAGAWQVTLTAPQQAELLAEYLDDPTARGYADNVAEEIAVLMNGTYLVANPTPQGTVPRTMQAAQMMNLGTEESPVPTVVELAAIKPYLIGENGMLAEILANNQAGILDWVGLMVALSDISPATGAAIQSYVEGTVPDPSWPAQVPTTPRAQAVITGVTDPNGNPAWLELEASDVTAATGVA